MTKTGANLHDALRDQKKGNKQTELEIHGSLGIPLGGQKLVEVPNRASFVYVRLRDTQNEVIQAFNNQVAASYNLPVILVRDGTRYRVVGVDTARYQDNWNNSSPYLPKHGHSHSFSESGGADTTFVFSRQIMPMLVYPSSQFTGTNVTVGAHTLLDNSRNWKYIGGTGTQSLLSYLPTGGNDAVMALVYMDAVTGNPGVLVGSGSYFSNLLTGTGDIYPYIPRPNPASQIPLAAIRMSSGTNVIDWNNLYDVRQWLQTVPTGTGGGGSTMFSGVDQIGVYGLSNGIPIGTGTWIDFGDNLTASRSGTVLRLDATASAGGGGGFGFAGLDEGIPIGTGSYLNVVGAGASFSRSGTMFELNVPGSSAGGVGVPVWDEGIPIGTGTTLNFTGNYVNASLSGTVVNVRIPDSQNDVPSTIRGLYLWLRSDYFSGFSNNQTITGTWQDYSGMENDASPIALPTVKTNQLNGQPSVLLNGSTQYFVLNTPFYSPTLSYFIVFNINSLAATYSAVLSFDPFTATNGYMIKSNGKSAEYFGANNYDGTGASTFVTGTWNYVMSNHRPALFDTRRNGIADKSNTTNAIVNSTTPFAYLGNNNVAGRFLPGNLVELIMYKRALTDAEIAKIEAYIQTRYGL